MCGRFAITHAPQDLIERFGPLISMPDFALPRFNIAPGQPALVLRQQSDDACRSLAPLQWGLVPAWAKDPAIGSRLVNARSETAAAKPSFARAFTTRRCVVPASGFYEWQSQGRNRQPFYFSLRDGQLMALAGLWESWLGPQGLALESFTILTTQANACMAPVHDRMPVLIAPDDLAQWLAPSTPLPILETLTKPCSEHALQSWPVSPRVNRASLDEPALVEPLTGPTVGQDDLFS